jgi:leader peptidase (prepilin peptidase) / N-methyltransferase
MDWIFYIFLFLFGLAAGSFLNCLIYRMFEQKSILKGFSFCPKCKHRLVWRDLVPVLSFVLLKGKCRYCGQKISLQYPLVEISSAFLFLLAAFKLQAAFFSPESFLLLFYLLFVISCLLIVFVFDLKHYLIPDKVIFSALIAVFAYRVFESLEIRNWNFSGLWDWEKGLLNPFLSAFLASGFFLSIVLFSRGRWMGLGDVKLAFLMGLFLGFPLILPALFLPTGFLRAWKSGIGIFPVSGIGKKGS